MKLWHRLFITACLIGSFAWAGGGCAQKPADRTEKGGTKGGHAHPTKGQHGGVVVEWAVSGKEEYHAEVVFDHDKKSATVYVLDDEVKGAVPIEAKEIDLNIESPEAKQIQLKAQPLENEKEGKSSRFVGTDDLFAKVVDFRGKVAGTIGGKRYSGGFDESKMEHDHKH